MPYSDDLQAAQIRQYEELTEAQIPAVLSGSSREQYRISTYDAEPAAADFFGSGSTRSESRTQVSSRSDSDSNYYGSDYDGGWDSGDTDFDSDW